MPKESSGIAISVGAIVAIALAGLLVPLRDWLAPTNVALLLAIVVVGAAMLGGRLAGASTSVAASLAFDFFHTQPYYSLRIDKREDVIASVLLLVLGLSVGELAVRRAGSQEQAQQHAQSASRLEQVAAIVAAGKDLDEVWPVVRGSLVDELQLADCRFEVAPFANSLIELERDGRIDSHHLQYEAGGFALPSEGVALLVIEAGRVLGRLVLVPQPHRGTTRPQRRVAVGLADQLAVAASRSKTLHSLS
jgi:K+-sensing histidine kinase KdpD